MLASFGFGHNAESPGVGQSKKEDGASYFPVCCVRRVWAIGCQNGALDAIVHALQIFLSSVCFCSFLGQMTLADLGTVPGFRYSFAILDD